MMACKNSNTIGNKRKRAIADLTFDQIADDDLHERFHFELVLGWRAPSSPDSRVLHFHRIACRNDVEQWRQLKTGQTPRPTKPKANKVALTWPGALFLPFDFVHPCLVIQMPTNSF